MVYKLYPDDFQIVIDNYGNNGNDNNDNSAKKKKRKNRRLYRDRPRDTCARWPLLLRRVILL